MNKMDKTLCSLFVVISFCLDAIPAMAVTPAGQDDLRIHTGEPRRNGETIISITGRWRIDGKLRYQGTGLSFFHGPDQPKPDNSASTAKKMVTAMKEGMVNQLPSWRGFAIRHDDRPEDPQFIMTNKAGMSFAEITIRDYTNQKFSAEIGGSSFSASDVRIAIYLVESAAVDKVAYMGYAAPKTKNFRATGGSIEVTMGNKTALIDTTGKALPAIEQALARKLGGSFSSSPIYPNSADGDERNVKEFDQGEIQFSRLREKLFTIDLKDPSIAVITKYKFKDENKSSSDALGGYLPYIVVLLVAGCVYYYRQQKKSPDESGNV